MDRWFCSDAFGMRCVGSIQACRTRAFEFKWGDKIPKAPKSWRDAYPDADYTVVDREKFWDFIL